MAWKVASAREYSRHSTQTYNIATDRATPSTKQVYEKKKKEEGAEGKGKEGDVWRWLCRWSVAEALHANFII